MKQDQSIVDNPRVGNVGIWPADRDNL